MVAACGQRGSGFGRQSGRVAGVLDLAGEDVGDQRFRGRIGGIEHDEPARSKHTLQPSTEGLGHTGARLVAAAKIVEERRRELCGRQCGLQLRKRSGDRLVQSHSCNGAGMCARQVAHRHGSRCIVGGEDAARLHFVPVVILGVHPEHRDSRHLMLGPHTFGELESCQRLEKREERSAKQSGLLAGDDGDRPGIGKKVGGGLRFGGCVSTSLLRPQHLNERVPLPALTRRTRNGVPPGARIARITGEEVGQARVVERVIGGKPPDPRKTTNINGKTTARGRVPLVHGTRRLYGQASVGLHLPVLLQSAERSVKKTGCECYDRSIYLRALLTPA